MKTGEEVDCEIEDAKDELIIRIKKPSDAVRKLYSVDSQKLIINGVIELALERLYLDMSDAQRIIHALFKDIKYICASKGIYTAHMVDLKDHGSIHYFDWFTERLPAHGFCRVHDSHIVSRAHIIDVKKQGRTLLLTMSDGKQLIVSETYKKAFLLWHSS